MSVEIGTVPTFKGASATKQQAVKCLEEAAEVFGAWQNWWEEKASTETVADECCDLIQATCNLLAGLGYESLEEAMQDCYNRNVERGRQYED